MNPSRRLLVVGTAALLVGILGTVAVESRHHPPGPSLPEQAATVVYTVPSTIAADCSRDVTVAVQNWINSRPNGVPGTTSTLRFKKNGCYRLDGALTLTDRHDLVIGGNGSTFSQPVDRGPNQPRWQWTGGSDIAVQNLHIKGPNVVSGAPGLPASYQAIMFEPDKFGASCGDGSDGRPPNCFESGIEFDHVDGVTVTNVTTDGTFGDGITLGGEHDASDLTSNVTLSNVSVDRNGRQGIGIGTVHGLLLDNVRVLHSWADAFDLEVNGSDGTIASVEIRNSYANTRTVAFASTGVAPVVGANVHDNTVRFSNPAFPWLDVAPQGGTGSGWQVVANTVLDDRDEIPGITFDNVTDVRIANNVSHENPPPAARAGETLPAVALGEAVVGPVTIQSNDFAGNTVVYQAAGSGGVSACSNRLTVGGAYDQPHPCP